MMPKRPYLILVVDDEADLEVLMQQRMRRSIRDGQYAFVFASNGLEALERLRQDNIDIVLSDINMPEMDGLTLLQQIPMVDPDVRSVIVTAYGDIDNIRTAMNRGAFDFITKPIDFEDLRATIERALEHRALLRQAARVEGDGEPASAAGSMPQTDQPGQAPVLIHMAPEAGFADDLGDGEPVGESEIKLAVVNATSDGIMVVAIEGRVDGSTIRKFARVLHAVGDACERAMILDFERLTYVNSAGLGVILSVAKSLMGRGATMAVCSVAEPLRRIFNVSGFDQIIPVHASQAEALAACTT